MSDVFDLNYIIIHMPGFVYWKNEKSQYMGCNNNLAKVSGLANRNEIIGKTDYDFEWGRHDAEKFIKEDQSVMKTGQIMVTENQLPIKRADGNYLFVRTEKRPFYDKHGKVIGVLAIAVDLTDQKLAEEREKLALAKEIEAQTKAEAEENLRRAVTIISGSIAHDLRTPLSILEMEAERLRKFMPTLVDAYHTAEATDSATGVIQEKLLNHFTEMGSSILEETSGMKEFISTSLKALSKAISGDTSAENLMLCSIDRCIDQTVRRYPFSERENQLIKWDRKEDFKFIGNEILMIRILFNLIKNALEQIKQENKGQIFISTEIGAKENFLHIKDTASGVPPEIVEHLFDGYKTTKSGGTGVGLAFCKKLMQDFGGDIICHSKYGDYIEFVLSFPKITDQNA